MENNNYNMVMNQMLKYIQLSLPVIPCKGKSPIIEKWQKRKKTEVNEVKEWGRRWGKINVGLPLGGASEIIGIDVDGKIALKRLNELSKGDLPITWTFQTPGGGIRYLYKFPPTLNPKKYFETLEGEHSEIALLGSGQQTLLPPSIHPNGGEYEWDEGKSPWNIEIADAPKWMLDLMTGIKNTTSEAVKKYSTHSCEVIKKLSQKCDKFKNVLEIQKNQGLCEEDWFKWIKILVSAGYGDDAITFSKLSTKHDKRSYKRLSELIEESPDGGPMIRCVTVGCNEDYIKKCCPKINTNEAMEVTNSPGAFIKNAENNTIKLPEIYNPYLKALENTQDYDIDKFGNLCAYNNKGNLYPLSNFVAKPCLEIIRDDGVNEERSFRIEGVQNGRYLPLVDVSYMEFLNMNWIIKAWGIKASIRAGFGRKDQLRDAIQSMASEIKKFRIFAHMGWRRLENKKWIYLHAGGAIGKENINVEIEKTLERYVLPDKINDLKKAVNASKTLLNVAGEEVTIPLLAMVYLSPLIDPLKRAGIEPNFLLWLYGGTGTRKTSMALLFLCHFGNFNGKNPPASFKDTANAIERKAFATKDTLLLIDDFHPESSMGEFNKIQQVAQKVIRMFGDRIGRGRLKPSIEFQREFPPRGGGICTGEDIPTGQSSIARLLGVEVFQNDVNLQELGKCQAKSKLLSEAMCGYIEWLIPQMEELPDMLSKEFFYVRDKFQKVSAHGRLGEAVSWITVAFEMMLKYFKDVGICSEDECKELLNRTEETMLKLILKQNSLINEEKPVDIFVKIFNELIISGKVKVESLNNKKSQDDIFHTGECIGWEDDNFYYLRPSATYNCTNKFLASRSEKFPVSERTLWKQLDEAGFIQIEESTDGRVQRCPKKTVPKNSGHTETQRLRLLYLKKAVLHEDD
jgi:hypothetical protein